MSKPAPHALDIYVGPGCFASAEARVIAERLSELQVPGLAVQVVDLADPAAIRPSSVFAVPTYVLDGRIVSLGNPMMDGLLQLIGRCLGISLGGGS